MGLSWAYTPPVPPIGHGDKKAATVPALGRRGRRRLPDPHEQARREAWGRKWGAILREHALTYRRKV